MLLFALVFIRLEPLLSIVIYCCLLLHHDPSYLVWLPYSVSLLGSGSRLLSYFFFPGPWLFIFLVCHWYCVNYMCTQHNNSTTTESRMGMGSNQSIIICIAHLKMLLCYTSHTHTHTLVHTHIHSPARVCTSAQSLIYPSFHIAINNERCNNKGRAPIELVHC